MQSFWMWHKSSGRVSCQRKRLLHTCPDFNQWPLTKHTDPYTYGTHPYYHTVRCYGSSANHQLGTVTITIYNIMNIMIKTTHHQWDAPGSSNAQHATNTKAPGDWYNSGVSSKKVSRDYFLISQNNKNINHLTLWYPKIIRLKQCSFSKKWEQTSKWCLVHKNYVWIPYSFISHNNIH